MLKGPSDLAWAVDDILHNKGDSATLFDQYDNAVSKVEYVKH